MPTRQEKMSLLLHYTERAEIEMEAERRRMSVSNLIRQKLGLPAFKHGKQKREEPLAVRN